VAEERDSGGFELSVDVVDALESLIRQLTGDDGCWMLEAHFRDGRFVRGYVKRGPVSREEMRVLGDRGLTFPKR
jgi:hypothetical protein